MKNQEMLWKNNDVKIQDEIKIIGQVYIFDYNVVEIAEGQRSLQSKGMKQISDSYSEFGICSCPIVIKRGKKYIVIDGQNRIEVAKRNGWNIICTLIESDCSENELMIILNTTQNNWNIEAFLNNGIVYHKNPDYVFLRELWEDTGVPLGALYELFSFNIVPSKRKMYFETGSWEATTKVLGIEVIDYIQAINAYATFSYKTNFIRGFSKCVNKQGFDINHLIKQMKKFPHHIHDSGDKVSGHQAMINKIYNHCCVDEQQVYLG